MCSSTRCAVGSFMPIEKKLLSTRPEGSTKALNSPGSLGEVSDNS